MTNADAGPSTGMQSWTFVTPTMLGDAQVTYDLRDGAFVYASNDAFDPGGATISWARIREGATAAMTGMGGPGAPQMPGWVPSRLEWLTLSVDDGPGFMRPLPAGPVRDEIVAALRERLGPRWRGEGLVLSDAQRRFGITSPEWGTAKVVGIVVAVLALMVAAVVVLGLLLTPFVLVPVCAGAGAWLLRRAWLGLQQADAAAARSRTDAALAQPGQVSLSGRAATDHPTRAPVSGLASVWWDMAVFIPQDDEGVAGWQQVAADHGGTIELVHLDDGTGTLPVWLDGAALLLASQAWESGKDVLPTAGLALLDVLGFPWHGPTAVRIVEQRLAVGAPLTVVGTAVRRRDLPAPVPPDWRERIVVSLVSGTWRRSLVGALPRPTRVPVAILIGYLDMVVRMGWSRERPSRIASTTLPDLPPDTLMIWKGRAPAPFLVSDRSPAEAVDLQRKRALLTGACGVAALGLMVYMVFEWAAG